ncbi:interleukin-17 receptor C [Bombina bombina]|uniref:interleukin-17 receptor C n=1 Tax=Bombina bombina TaxID=8345 RepID=UPI00235A985B|nr:interleukin-17 receptor C [Bombina bombina]
MPGWCLPGDMEKSEYPVLVPTHIKTRNILRCAGSNDCFPCVQVEVDMSVDFLTEKIEELQGENCDEYISDSYVIVDDEDKEYEYNNKEYEYDDIFTPEPKSQINGSYLCTNLFISRVYLSNSYCEMVRVSIPLASVPHHHGMGNMTVGKVVLSCFDSSPGNEQIFMVYTQPRYHGELQIKHQVAGCANLSGIEDIKQCQVPRLNISIGSNITVRLLDATSNRSYNLFLTYNMNKPVKAFILKGKDILHIPNTDIVPCLCFLAWWTNLTDARRKPYCPFLDSHQYEENIWRQSNLSVIIDSGILLYEFTAPCNRSVEVSLCLRSSENSRCQELPLSRTTVFIRDRKIFPNLQPHPSLCVQVTNRDKILHTRCPNEDSSNTVKRNDVFIQVLHYPYPNSSLCIMKGGNCSVQYNLTDQALRGIGLRDQRALQDFKSDKCMKFKEKPFQSNVKLSGSARLCESESQDFIAIWFIGTTPTYKNGFNSSQEYHLKGHETHFKPLLQCVKLMAGDNSLDETFNHRKVLILYSPDNRAYEELVNVLASSLKELKLDVVLDQWHRTDMNKVNPLPWYQSQKTSVLEDNGIIILLFSEGAKQRYLEWKEKTPFPKASCDPYGAFGAILNCIFPDFLYRTTAGRYVVACFDHQFNRGDIPEVFRVVPNLTLPSQLVELLTELAGSKLKAKLKKRMLQRLSAKVRKKLQSPMQKCQLDGHQTIPLDKQIPVSLYSEGNELMELHNLI